MLFFINPVTTLVDSLSQEKALTKAYLGLSESMTKPITNSVGEFRFYYSRFLGYIVHNLESTIAEIEGKAIATATAPTPEALVVEPVQTSSTYQPPEIANTEIVVEAGEAGEVGEVGETEEEEDWPIPETESSFRMTTPEKNQPPKKQKEESPTEIEEEIAVNAFTGLVPSPKPQVGSITGKQQDSPPSEPSVVQTELDLKTPPPPEQKKSKVTATPLLELVASEIKKVNPELTFDYEDNGKSTFLDIYHGSSSIGTFEDDGEDLWSFNTAKMLHHGFTKEMIDALGEIELSPKA